MDSRALFAALVAACPLACDNGAPSGNALPLRLLTLYETGLGYYERAGTLSAGQVAEVPLEPNQLDDALKTLVITSEGGVAFIEYEPPLAAQAASAEAGLDSEDSADLEGLLGALRGARVTVERRSGGTLEGRVVSVDHGRAGAETANKEPARLIVFGANGLASCLVNDVVSVRPEDTSVREAWDRAARAKSRRAPRTSIRVNAGDRGGKVAIGYTTEAAVWRTTYRLLMSKSNGARIQGFAIVHNNSDEAWNDVRISLVSGRPRSFLFPMALPRYGRRELVSPEVELDVAPQLATQEARDHLGGLSGSLIGESVGLGGLGTVGYGAGGGGLGSGSIGVRSVLEEGPSAVAAAAVSEAGDLFLYTVKEPVRLGARKSALLPIIDARIGAEDVTVIAANGAASNGVRLSNDTPLVLEGGVLAVFAENAFAGETQIDRVKPGEVRVLAHGEDLDLEVHRATRSGDGETQRVSRREGAIEIHRIDRAIDELEVISRSDRPRTLLVALAPGDRRRVTSGGEEDVRSPGQPRYARLALGPRERMKTSIVEEGGTVELLDPSLITLERIDRLLSGTALDAASKSALTRMRSEVAKIEAAGRERALATKRLQEAEADLARLRSSVTAAGEGGASTGAVAAALARKLLAAEEHLDLLRADRDRAERVVETAKQAILGAFDAP